MAYGIGATLGTGASDIITSAFAAQLSGVVSVGIRVNRHGNGAAIAKMLTKYNGSSDSIVMQFAAVNGGYGFQTANSANQGGWRFTAPPVDEDHSVIFTYDPASTSNDPIGYLDGVSQSITEGTTPTGTGWLANTSAVTLGNRGSSLDSNFDGILADFFLLNVIATATEAAAYAAGFSPLEIWKPNTILEYLPLIGNGQSWKTTPATISGALVQAHPRTIPLPRRVPGLVGTAGPGFEIATGVTLAGPTHGASGAQSTSPFTIGFDPSTAGRMTDIIVTPSDGGDGGTFNPTSVTLAANTPGTSATFAYTPAGDGLVTISVTNDRGLTDPGSIDYTSPSPAIPNIGGGTSNLIVLGVL